MSSYNVKNIGGEILNLDGPLSRDEANRLANEIEQEHNIDVRVVESTTVQIKEGEQLVFCGDVADAPKTPFIADLIRDALRSAGGSAEREDAEGCLVTCVVLGGSYRYGTDSESGTIEAANFDEAKQKLEKMIGDADGGFGWVEDHDGYRYEIGK